MRPAFGNLSIGLRLAIGFALLIGAALAITLYARSALVSAKAGIDLLTDDQFAKIDQLVDLKNNVNQIARSVRTLVLTRDEATMTAELQAINAAKGANVALFNGLAMTVVTDEGKELLRRMGAAREPYNDDVAKVTDLGQAGKAQEATAVLLGSMSGTQAAFMKSLDDLITHQKEMMRKANDEATQSVARSSATMLGIAAIAAVFGAALAWVIARSITRPIHEAVRIAETVAAGDLRSQFSLARRDETGQLLDALRRMNDNLVGIVADVRGNADSVSTASTQIAQGNADLSQRTEQQAGGLQQTAASMEQLTAAVRHNADTARQATELAAGASTVASEGGRVVGQVVATMEDISASSRKIGDIIGVIDGIAFQTNILALNAAVEAARAGEQGRGFAVVAGEVRGLAQRSADAAREIKALIVASVERVEAGSGLVGDAGRTMGEVVNQVKRVSELIAEISAASVEQTTGIGQVGNAVAQLDQVTQQNAALVEQSAAAAQSLQQQAARLAQTVAVFRTHDDADAPQAGAGLVDEQDLPLATDATSSEGLDRD